MKSISCCSSPRALAQLLTPLATTTALQASLRFETCRAPLPIAHHARPCTPPQSYTHCDPSYKPAFSDFALTTTWLSHGVFFNAKRTQSQCHARKSTTTTYLEFLDTPLECGHFGRLGRLLCRAELNSAHTGGKVERVDSLVDVLLDRRDLYHHERLGGTA